MKSSQKIAMLLITLVLSMPLCFAAEMNLVYDPNGNLVSGDGFYRVYNSLNQLWRVYDSNDTTTLLEEYKYHPVEERVWEKKEYDNGSLVETTYYINQNTVKVVNTSGMFNYTYVYSNGQLVAESHDGVKTFTHTDNKGSVIATTNSTGAIIEKTFYDPFGAVLSGGTSTRYGYEAKEHTIDSVDAVGYWSLDKNNLTTGGYTFYNGVASGAVQSTFGKYGKSYYFDGNNDYINISKNVLQSSNFTIMFWSYTPSANNNTGYIFCDANAASNLLFRRYDNGVHWSAMIGGVGMGETTTEIPRDVWVHTAIVLNGTKAYVYVNGVKMNMTGTTTGITFTGLTTSLFLGNRQVLDRDYEGYLDNFQTYSRAMSQSEIQNVYNSEHPSTGNKLVSSFEFEQAVNDSNNLIMGEYDGAYRFEHQYVDVPDYNALDITSDITISAWVYPTSGAQGYVVSKWRSYILQFTGSTYGNTMQGAVYTSGSFTPLATSTTIPSNTWSHVVFTYNKTISKIYINGELSGTQTYTGSIDTNNNKLTIGARNSTDRTRDFNGTVDEVNVFNTALTDEEITELYTTGEITAKEYKDFNFRNYNPTLGIFTQPDTLIQNLYDPQTLNRYAFERNSPYNYIDPDGHNPYMVAAGVFLIRASIYWYNTPIDPSNPQWGDRFMKGAAHGANAASFFLLGLPLAYNSVGRVIIGGATMSNAGRAVVAGVSELIWDHNIDSTQTNIQEITTTAVTSFGFSFAPGLSQTGQYVSQTSSIGAQDLNMFGDYLLGYGGSTLLDFSMQSNEAKDSTQDKSSGRGNSGGGSSGGSSSNGGSFGSSYVTPPTNNNNNMQCSASSCNGRSSICC